MFVFRNWNNMCHLVYDCYIEVAVPVLKEESFRYMIMAVDKSDKANPQSVVLVSFDEVEDAAKFGEFMQEELDCSNEIMFDCRVVDYNKVNKKFEKWMLEKLKLQKKHKRGWFGGRNRDKN